jgi:hypothetical protein
LYKPTESSRTRLAPDRSKCYATRPTSPQCWGTSTVWSDYDGRDSAVRVTDDIRDNREEVRISNELINGFTSKFDDISRTTEKK